MFSFLHCLRLYVQVLDMTVLLLLVVPRDDDNNLKAVARDDCFPGVRSEPLSACVPDSTDKGPYHRAPALGQFWVY